MDSESSMQSSSWPLYANGCGFFGRPETQNMCSKCYRDLVLNNNYVPATVELSSSVDTREISPAKVLVLPITESSNKMEMAGCEDGAAKPWRCGHCHKKVGLARRFSCRCGDMYCPLHRYPEEHDCEFDFKGTSRKLIAKANPVIKADKLERI